MPTLLFQADRETLLPGEVLSGRLQVFVQPGQTIKTSGLEIYFRGKEYTTIVTGSGKNKRFYEGKALVGRSDLKEVSRWATRRIIRDGAVLPGTHLIPFKIHLRGHLPASTRFDGVGNAPKLSAKIEYCLRARLSESGVFTDYEARKAIRILGKPVPDKIAPRRVEPFAAHINRLRMWEKGEMTIGAKVVDTELFPGQKAGVILALKNNSGATPKSLSLSLKQIYRVKASNKEKQVSKVLSSRFFLMKHLHKYEPLTKQELKSLNKIDILARRCENRRAILHELDHAPQSTEFLQLVVPPHTAPQFQSKLIKVSHELVVKIHTDDLCTNPSFSIPVTISPRAPPRAASSPVDPVAPRSTPVVTAEMALPVAMARPISEESLRNYPEFAVQVVPILG
ncbi:expressed unknown protein [Seminavis robusta]|uniref:Arrestin C-terminal-like domain-containing protein n=1 Tax=Seminavis robusta TaxID=568900 RepID=A0A9N8HG11_9STRA|nr:expressed unknown protein [Seminavis robusta]|eukprot:Sro551_g164910.1 n/a (396) ;mRNA; f:41301-42488